MKAISWRALATCTTVLLVFIFTRRLVVSIEVGMAELVIKTFLYYLHERLWEWIRFGKARIWE